MEKVCDEKNELAKNHTCKAPSRAGKGGPKTPEGKEISRQNALKHGLRSQGLGLDEEQNAVFKNIWFYLYQEHQPKGQTEDIFVREMWRHACFLHLATDVEGACFRWMLSSWLGDGPEGAGDGPLSALQVPLSGGVAENRLALIARYRRMHERGFYDAYRALMTHRGMASKKPVGIPEWMREGLGKLATCRMNFTHHLG
ncbi:MAG: hypothetical protein AB1696_23115 [Planctomycetota bacterium]